MTQGINPALATIGTAGGLALTVGGSVLLVTAAKLHAIMATLVAAGVLGTSLGTGATVGLMVGGAALAVPLLIAGGLAMRLCSKDLPDVLKLGMVLLVGVAILALTVCLFIAVGGTGAMLVGKFAGASEVVALAGHIRLVNYLVFTPLAITTVFAGAATARALDR